MSIKKWNPGLLRRAMSDRGVGIADLQKAFFILGEKVTYGTLRRWTQDDGNQTNFENVMLLCYLLRIAPEKLLSGKYEKVKLMSENPLEIFEGLQSLNRSKRKEEYNERFLGTVGAGEHDAARARSGAPISAESVGASGGDSKDSPAGSGEAC